MTPPPDTLQREAVQHERRPTERHKNRPRPPRPQNLSKRNERPHYQNSRPQNQQPQKQTLEPQPKRSEAYDESVERLVARALSHAESTGFIPKYDGTDNSHFR
jgi:hypothetical protein